MCEGGKQMKLSNRNREETLQALKKKTYDLLIIGGGLTGASIALDATTRGMDTVLLDMADFGSGGSYRQSMLSFEQGDYYYKTWKDLEREKETIASNFSALYHITTGMYVKYRGDLDLKNLTTIKRSLLFPLRKRQSADAIQIMRKKEIQQFEPLVNQMQLERGFLFENGIINRSFMAIELIKQANQLGTDSVNYLKVTQFIYDQDEQIIGVEAEDQINGDSVSIYARRVINATGKNFNRIRKLDVSDQKQALPQTINKKTLIYLNATIPPIKCVLTFNDIKRKSYVTVIPGKGNILMTSIEKLTRPESLVSRPTEADMNHYLNLLNQVIKDYDFNSDDVTDANLTYEVDYESNNDLANVLMVSDAGLISVLGTETEAYRLYAGKIVDDIARGLKKEVNILYSNSETNVVAINRKKQLDLKEFDSLAIDQADLTQLTKVYGDQTVQVLKYYQRSEKKATKHQLNRLLCAELLYSIEQTAIYTPLDFFIRRTRISYDLDQVREQKKGILNLLAHQLAWTKEERSYFERELNIWLTEQT